MERHTPSFAMTLPRECDRQDAEKRILNGRWRDHRAFVVIVESPSARDSGDRFILRTKRPSHIGSPHRPDFLEHSFREREPTWRELGYCRAHVWSKLPSRVMQITNLPDVVQGSLVLLEES
jgi:hypothetical protein